MKKEFIKYTSLLKVISFFLVFNNSSIALSQDNEELNNNWSYLIHGFRSAHNLKLSLDTSLNNWEVAYAPSDSKKSNILSGTSYSLNLGYFYHININGKLGYYLGSNLGYSLQSIEDDTIFTPAKVWKVPGLIIGLVYDFTTISRTGIQLNLYIRRHEQLEFHVKDDNNPDTKATSHQSSVTSKSYEVSIFYDHFYNLTNGVRISIKVNNDEFIPPTDAELVGEVNFKMKNISYALSIGYINHVL